MRVSGMSKGGNADVSHNVRAPLSLVQEALDGNNSYYVLL